MAVSFERENAERAVPIKRLTPIWEELQNSTKTQRKTRQDVG